eukprot:1160831-Pelagomonas_calceolata.AAC.1
MEKVPIRAQSLQKCDWHTVEEHIIPSQDQTNLRAQFQHLYSSAPPSSASRLDNLKFMSVTECASNTATEKYVLLFFSRSDWVGKICLTKASRLQLLWG